MANDILEFRLRQRVQFTEEAERVGLVTTYRGKRVTTGRVEALRWPWSVKVRRTGYKEASWYHVKFWQAARNKRRSTLRRQRRSLEGK